MTVLPFPVPHGLTHAEVAALVIFANGIAASIETGTTEEGWGYAALDFGSCYGIPQGAAVWVVSREQGKVVAYDEDDGALLSFKTVEEALAAFRRLLPAKQSQFA